ncbi:MAG: hypothetical protein JWP88_782 [Flaviaesturariibacter sp.]|nr:hypothetical protein [Flaviaesturariibacter sp.]
MANEKDQAKGEKSGQHENPLPREISQEDKKLTEAAHHEADKDIDADAELSAHSPNDDLDEGETARLGENPEGI